MIIEVTKIEWEKVRAKCIEKDWYTMGDCAEYQNMLNMCTVRGEDASYSIKRLEKIARDIYEHSDPDCWCGYDDNPILNIMFELRADACYTYFEEL